MTHLFDHLTALIEQWDAASLSWVKDSEERVTEIMVELELNLDEIREQTDLEQELEEEALIDEY